MCVCLLSLGGFWKCAGCGRCYGRFPGAWGAWKDSFINLSFLQAFKGRPRKNRFGSCQAGNSPSTPFQLCFESWAPRDLMLCWKLTKVLSTPASQNLTKLPRVFLFFFSSHSVHTHLEGKMVTKEPGDKRFEFLMIDLHIISPKCWRWEKSCFYYVNHFN